MNYTNLPKVELHLHLDCSLSYPLVFSLDPTITREEYQDKFIAPDKCLNLADYLTRISPAVELMQTAENLRLVVDDLFEQLAAENVIYAEIRFGPLLHTKGGLSPQEVVKTVEAAVTEAIPNTGVEARLILCTLRHYTAEQSMQVVKLVEAFRGTFVTGFDIAADEAGYPINAHIPAFQYANKMGINCTAHAGEACGPETVWQTLLQLKPSRIGHGVRSIEDPQLVEHLRENQIHLEICPTCNIQTGIFPTLAGHSIDTFYRAGLPLSINTDCRTTSNISLSQEYEKLHDTFGWKEKDFYTCNRHALESAFVDDDTWEWLLAELVSGYSDVGVSE